jgi:hypothetical protein
LALGEILRDERMSCFAMKYGSARIVAKRRYTELFGGERELGSRASATRRNAFGKQWRFSNF